MKNKKLFIVLSLTFVVLLAVAAIIYNNFADKINTEKLTEAAPYQNSEVSETDENTEVFPAPDFTVNDIDGNPVKLSDMKGKPTVVNFWASWCGPCKSEMPDFEEAYKEYKDEINFMMVNLTDGYSETVDTAKKYIDSKGYTFPVYYDTESIAAYTYNVYAIPMTCFIDADGNFVVYANRAIDRATLQQGIDMIYTAAPSDEGAVSEAD